MRKLTAAVVVTMVVGGLAFLGCKDQGPTGKAIGTVARSADFVALEKAMWESLTPYKDSFLQAHASQLQALPDDPLALLKAMEELMGKVTGPSGLWRAHVPQQYFGCAANHGLPVCQQLEKLESMSYLPWETLQIQISTINTPQEAEAFLAQYGDKIKKYISYYVPQNKSLSAVQETPFFKDQLSAFLPK